MAADSLAPRRVGSLMFPIAQHHVAEAVLVEDEAIRDAQRRLWDVLRIATKPGGAAALAALLSGRYRPAKDERVAVLLCGRQHDRGRFRPLTCARGGPSGERSALRAPFQTFALRNANTPTFRPREPNSLRQSPRAA
jgi:threonine dehydratase